MPQITGRNYLWTNEDKKRGAKDRAMMGKARQVPGQVQRFLGTPIVGPAERTPQPVQPGTRSGVARYMETNPSMGQVAMDAGRAIGGGIRRAGTALGNIGTAESFGDLARQPVTQRPPIDLSMAQAHADTRMPQNLAQSHQTYTGVPTNYPLAPSHTAADIRGPRLQGNEESRLTPRAMDSPAPPPNITQQPGMMGKRGPLPVSQSMGQPQQQPQPAGFQPDENMINFWLDNLEKGNTNVKSLPGGAQVVSGGVMVPGLSTEEHYNYTPDMREAYAEKIRQQLIENNRQREEFSRNNPRGGIVETIRGMDQTFRNTQGSREYGSLGEAQRQRSFEQDAAQQALEADLEKERIKAKADTDSAVIRGRYGVEQAKVGATNKAKDYTKDRADYGKWYSDNMSGAGGDPVKARILGEQLWDVQNADKIDAKVFTDPQTGDIKLKYKDGAEVVIPASDLNGNDLVSNWDWGRTDWRKQNQRGIS